MVDVVGRADIVTEAEQIADGSQHIVDNNVLRDEVVLRRLDVFDELLFALALSLCSLQQIAQDGEANLLLDAALLLRVKGDKVLHVNHAVAEHLDARAVVGFDDRAVYAAARNAVRLLAAENRALIRENLAGHGVGNRLTQLVADQAAGNVELFVVLVAADRGNVIAAGVKEQRAQQAARRINRGRLARAQLFIDFNQGLLDGLGRILVEGRQNALILTEQIEDFRIRFHADGADKRGDRNFSVFINADVENVVAVGLVLQPCAAVRDDSCGQQRLVGLVERHAVVYARRTNNLRDDDALRAVDDKRAGIGHAREIAHEQLLLLDLTGLLVAQTHPHAQRAGICGVARLALLHGVAVFRIVVERVVDERQLQIAGVVADGPDILEHLAQTVRQKPLIRFFLNLDEVRHLQDVRNPGKALAGGAPVLHVMDVDTVDCCFVCHIAPITPFLKYSIRLAA